MGDATTVSRRTSFAPSPGSSAQKKSDANRPLSPPDTISKSARTGDSDVNTRLGNQDQTAGQSSQEVLESLKRRRGELISMLASVRTELIKEGCLLGETEGNDLVIRNSTVFVK